MQKESEKLIEEVAALINPYAFGDDANALLDAWAGKSHDRDAARRADVKFGLGLGVHRVNTREVARAITALVVERCADKLDPEMLGLSLAAYWQSSIRSLCNEESHGL